VHTLANPVPILIQDSIRQSKQSRPWSISSPVSSTYYDHNVSYPAPLSWHPITNPSNPFSLLQRLISRRGTGTRHLPPCNPTTSSPQSSTTAPLNPAQPFPSSASASTSPLHQFQAITSHSFLLSWAPPPLLAPRRYHIS